MVRADLKKKSSTASKIFGLMLINIIPIAALAALGWAFATDRLSVDDLPEGWGESALRLGAVFALLVVTASAFLPLVHGAARSLRAQLGAARARREAGEGGSRFLDLLLWPFRFVAYVVFWLLRFSLYLASIALILAVLLLVIRFVQPEFFAEPLPLEEWLDCAWEWIRNRYERWTG